MNIKIIGSNCSNGIKLKKMLFKAINDVDEVINVELKDDQLSLNKYNIKNIPGLVINGKLLSEGKVLTDREIKKFIKSYA
ncbi:MAG: thioredoxin family protein [Bacilli bacterium]